MGANTGVGSPAQRLVAGRQALETLRAELDDPQVTGLTIAVLTLITLLLVRVTGGAPSALMELGFLPVALAAYAFGAYGGLATGVAVAATLGPAPALLGFDRVEGPIEWLIRVAAFGGVGAALGAALEGTLRVDTNRLQPQRPANGGLGGLAPRHDRGGNAPTYDRTAPAPGRDQPALLPAHDGSAAVTVTERPAEAADSTVGERPARPTDDREHLLAVAHAAESRDTDAGEHLRRLALLSRKLAERSGMSQAVAAEIGAGAMFHDIGKLRVPERILLKPEPLDPDEWTTVRLHPVWGEEALEGQHLALARQIARSHHENWDGTGYPDGLYGDRIPLPARIVRIVDAFDAMTNERPYQRPVSFEAAIEELRANAGRDFDPELVGPFVELLQSDAALRAELTSPRKP